MRAVTDPDDPTDGDPVPKPLRTALLALLLLAGLTSIPDMESYGPIPTTALLDAWMLTFILARTSMARILTSSHLILLGLYLATVTTLALFNNAPMIDFLQAYRWILYLAAFLFAVGGTWGPIQPLRIVTFTLISMAVLKAMLTYALIGPGERPGLLLENNFEIALFSGLIAVLYSKLTPPQRLLGVTMLFTYVILAGSRSGAVLFSLVILYALLQTHYSRATKALALVYAIPFVISAPLLVFANRDEALGRVDRLLFLDVFLKESQNWGPTQWLLGTAPLTPLSESSCARLSFYQSLFSSTGDGQCYSVILHAFILRVIFDAGVLGLALAFGLAWIAMRRGGVPISLSITLLGIAGANSLSVSGLNNPYVALPILLAIMLSNQKTLAPRVASAHGNVAARLQTDVDTGSRQAALRGSIGVSRSHGSSVLVQTHSVSHSLRRSLGRKNSNT